MGPHMTNALLLNEVSCDEQPTSVLISIERCRYVPKKSLSNAVSAGNETVTSVYMRQQMLLKNVIYGSTWEEDDTCVSLGEGMQCPNSDKITVRVLPPVFHKIYPIACDAAMMTLNL